MKRDVSVLVNCGGPTGWHLELGGNGDVGRKTLQSICLQSLYALCVASLQGTVKREGRERKWEREGSGRGRVEVGGAQVRVRGWEWGHIDMSTQKKWATQCTGLDVATTGCYLKGKVL